MYYVDKTSFLKAAMLSDPQVLLLTRPRRFGKTLFMDTLRSFLQLNPSAPGNIEAQTQLFHGLKILEDKPFCQTFMGQHPVIFISLKPVDDPTFEEAYKSLAFLVSSTAVQHAYLSDSPRLEPEEKARFANYRNLEHLKNLSHRDEIKVFLKDLVAFLSKHYQRKTVLLIDEYDVPLAKAAAYGYYSDMQPIIRGMLSEALKPSPDTDKCLKKAILTGCLRVGKESIFTGLNNPGINSVCSEDKTLSEAIGFTESEVKTLLRDFGLTSHFAVLKAWYDGYRFHQSDIYCPWDVVNFCSDALHCSDPLQFRPRNYWANSSDNLAIREFLGFLSGDDTDKMQRLLDGGTIDIIVNEKLNYGELSQHNPADFWTLLFFTGYLTIAERLPESVTAFRVRIPNQEVLETFQDAVKQYFSKDTGVSAQHGLLLAKAAFSGDDRAMKNVLRPVLEGYVSVRDAASRAKPENYYQGFLSALLACAGAAVHNFSANHEAGDGYADILFTSAREDIGVVIEIKRCQKKEDMIQAAESALKQVQARRYAQGLREYDCVKSYAYGIAFCGKSCIVRGQAI